MNILKRIVGFLFNRHLLKWGGYFVFFCSCFSVFSYLTFPYDRLKQSLVEQFNDSQKGIRGNNQNGFRVKVDSLSPYYLSGVKLSGVKVIKMQEKPDVKPIVISLQTVTLRHSLFSFLAGKSHTTFEFQVGEGSVKGYYDVYFPQGAPPNQEPLPAADKPNSPSAAAQWAQNRRRAPNLQKRQEAARNRAARVNPPPPNELFTFYTRMDRVDLMRIGAEGFIGLPIKGIMGGTIDIDTKQERGDIQLSIKKLTLGDGKAKYQVPGMAAGVTIDTIKAGNLQLRIKIREEVAVLDQLSTDGPDLKIKGSGSVELSPNMEDSRLDLAMEFKFSPEYKTRSERTKAMFDLMQLQPTIKRALTSDGTMRYKVRGLAEKPRFIPSAGG